jgi:hypothetical protein
MGFSISLFFGYKKGWFVALVAQSRRIIQDWSPPPQSLAPLYPHPPPPQLCIPGQGRTAARCLTLGSSGRGDSAAFAFGVEITSSAYRINIEKRLSLTSACTGYTRFYTGFNYYGAVKGGRTKPSSPISKTVREGRERLGW